MSHRTRDLPPTHALGRGLRELRYHEVSRQLLGVLLILVFAATAEPTPLLVAIGAPLAVLGTLVRLWASGFITKNAELARSGPYALVRHPLYTGNILVLVGLGIANGHWWALPVAAVFFWFYYPPAIEYEDRKLRNLFGAQWEQWAARVPALVPRFAPAPGVTEGEWSFGRSFRRNGEILIAVYILACVYWVVQLAL